MSDLCVCMRDVISEFNSEIEGSLAFCALMLFLCSILCLMCPGSSVHVGCILPVFSVMCSELLIMSEISCPLWSSVCEYQSVECAFTSPVSIESGMLVTCRAVCDVCVHGVVVWCLLMKSTPLLLCCLWSCLCVF